MSGSDLDRLIPHRPPLRLVEEIVGECGGEFICRGRIPLELAADGWTSPLLAVELGAQAAAVLGALERARAEGDAEAPPIGYLVTIRDAQIAAPAIRAGEPLTARVRQAGSVHPLTKYAVSVWGADSASPLVTATIGTYLLLGPGAL